MFSTILAYAAFICISLTFVGRILAEVTTSQHQREIQRMIDRLEGKRTVTNWPLILVLFLIWAGSGVFLWG